MTLCTGACQLTWLAKGLRHVEVQIMVPTFACTFTIFSIISGSTFFQEFKGFCTERIVLFAIAVIISLVGVALLYQRAPGEGQPSEIIAAASVPVDPSDKTGTHASSAPATALPAPGPVPSSAEAGAARSSAPGILSSQKSYPALASLSWLSAAESLASEVHPSPRPSGHKRTNSSGGAVGAVHVAATTRQKPTHRRTHSEPVHFESVTAALPATAASAKTASAKTASETAV